MRTLIGSLERIRALLPLFLNLSDEVLNDLKNRKLVFNENKIDLLVSNNKELEDCYNSNKLYFSIAIDLKKTPLIIRQQGIITSAIQSI